jgi:hypothetical protein
MQMNSENDIRRWVRDQKGINPRWVEPAQGSTIGTPDLWFMVSVDGHPITVWVELKLAVTTDGLLKFEVRPQQRKVLRGILNEGGTAFILAGQKKGAKMWLMNPNEAALSGRVQLDDPQLLALNDGPLALVDGVFKMIGS